VKYLSALYTDDIEAEGGFEQVIENLKEEIVIAYNKDREMWAEISDWYNKQSPA